MQKHECSALRLLTCNHCQQMYSSLASMRRHVKRQHMSTHTCHACGARYSNPFTLRRHREVCLPTSCSQCHEIFPSKAALERHMRLTHDAQFVCRFCGKRYALQAKLADHERSHTNERPFVCDLCPNKAFTSKAYLLAHMKHKHIPRKDKLCCDVCRKSFASVKGLRSHRVTHFAELKKYICHICKAAFHARHNLASHQLVHTGEKAFTCEVCGAPFTRRSSLKAHISFKHSDELATHLCPECGKRFPQTSHLKRHLLTHTGERSHLCDVCGKSFSQVAHLHTHKRLRHKVLPYGCVDCGKQFKLKTDLLTHMGEH